MYFPPPWANARRFASDTIPASPTNTLRASFHPRRSAFTWATISTSTVSPRNTQERTGKPSRVIASPTTTCGTSLRLFFAFPRCRSAG